MPNQIFDSQASTKYCDKINNQFEHKNMFADDFNWLGRSWFYYNKVIYGKCKAPTLQQIIDGFMAAYIQNIEEKKISLNIEIYKDAW